MVKINMSYTEKLLLKNRIKLVLFYILMLAVPVLFFLHEFREIRERWQIFSIFLIFTFYGFVLRSLSEIFFKKAVFIEEEISSNIDNAKKGNEGEKMVFAELDRILDKGKYFVHKNFIIPGHQFDIDAIIVGPKGVVAFEIKNWTKGVFFGDKEAFIDDGKEPKRLFPNKDPRNELRVYSNMLDKYLATGKINVKTTKAVVFLNGPTGLGKKTGIYIIPGITRIEKYIMELPDNPKFTPNFCAKINNFLQNNI